MVAVEKLSTISNALLTFLEKISEENIWKSVLGERVVNLLQKYFGNDVVALSLAFYIAPILRSYWTKLSTNIFKRVEPAGTVVIRIYPEDQLYDVVGQYAFEHGSNKDNLTTGVAQYSDAFNASEAKEDWYQDNWDNEESSRSESDSGDAAKVKIRPPSAFDEELVYKGHTIKIEFKDPIRNDDEKEDLHIAVSMVDRDTRRLHCILQEWSDMHNKTQTSKYIYKPCGSYWECERAIPDRVMDSVHLRDGQKEHLIKDMQTFKTRADWYTKRGIPHRRGYLFYGPPGTGKTSMIQAIANYLKHDLAILGSIAAIPNETLPQLIQNMPYNSILLIEDIDHLFESSGNTNMTKKVTMSGLLNTMDGLQSRSGCMVFMTCNNINKITPALLRPGRIDLKLHFGYAMPEQVKETFWRFMGLDEETSMSLADEEKAIAEQCMEKFEKLIPSNQITTAELQGYFIDTLLEANANGWTRDRVYEALLDRVPKFLEDVERDRKQAKEHMEAQKKTTADEDSKEEEEVASS